MDVEAFLEGMPFTDTLGIEVTDVGDGRAEGRLDMRPELSWSDERVVAHGGVTFTLADTVGGAALLSLVDQPVPTIDMRIDYLEAGTGDLRAVGEVVRLGGDVGVVDVDVYAETDEGVSEIDEGVSEIDEGDSETDEGDVDAGEDVRIADARGVYKTG